MQLIKGRVAWIDVFKPNHKDLEQLRRLHDFHPIILEELLHPSARTHVENHKSYLFMVLHLPVYDPSSKTSRRAEIDFLITKQALVTVRYESLEQFDTFLNSLARDAKLQKEVLGSTTLIPLYRILEEIMNFSLRQLRHIEEQVSYVAKEIFQDHSSALLKQISYTKRNVLDYRLITRPHEKLFASLKEHGESFWGEDSKAYLNDLQSDSLRILHNLENYFETIESLETTNAQLLDAATNQTIQRFTVLAFVFTIPMLYIFATDISYIGDFLLATPARFWITFIAANILSVWLAYRFKRNKLF